MSALSLGEPPIVSLRSCLFPSPPETVITMHAKALCKLQSPISVDAITVNVFAKALLSRLCYRSFKMGSCKRKRRNGISDQMTLGKKKMLHFAFDTVPTLKSPRCPDIKKPI